MTGSSKQLCNMNTDILCNVSEKLFAVWCKLNLRSRFSGFYLKSFVARQMHISHVHREINVLSWSLPKILGDLECTEVILLEK